MCELWKLCQKEMNVVNATNITRSVDSVIQFTIQSSTGPICKVCFVVWTVTNLFVLHGGMMDLDVEPKLRANYDQICAVFCDNLVHSKLNRIPEMFLLRWQNRQNVSLFFSLWANLPVFTGFCFSCSCLFTYRYNYWLLVHLRFIKWAFTSWIWHKCSTQY